MPNITNNLILQYYSKLVDLINVIITAK